MRSLQQWDRHQHIGQQVGKLRSLNRLYRFNALEYYFSVYGKVRSTNQDCGCTKPSTSGLSARGSGSHIINTHGAIFDNGLVHLGQELRDGFVEQQACNLADSRGSP
jgi:hypothetical protein